MSRRLKVAVCGGGNLAHAFGAVIGAVPECDVTVLTRRPGAWGGVIDAVLGDAVVRGHVRATAGVEDAVGGADVVLLAVPAPAHEAIMRAVAPHLAPGACVGALPAVGGVDQLALPLLPAGGCVFGSARSPYNCRISRYGSEVEVLGVAPEVQLAVRPARCFGRVAERLGLCLGLPLQRVEPFLAVTLSPAATIFHPSRLASLAGRGFTAPATMYEEWDDEASRTYLACDDDLSALAVRLGFDRHGMQARDHYGVADPEGLTARIRGLPGLRGIAAPMRWQGGEWRLDAGARFVTEDLPYGLALVERLGALARLATPAACGLLDRLRRALQPHAPVPLAPPRRLVSLTLAQWCA